MCSVYSFKISCWHSLIFHKSTYKHTLLFVLSNCFSCFCLFCFCFSCNTVAWFTGIHLVIPLQNICASSVTHTVLMEKFASHTETVTVYVCLLVFALCDCACFSWAFLFVCLIFLHTAIFISYEFIHCVWTELYVEQNMSNHVVVFFCQTMIFFLSQYLFISWIHVVIISIHFLCVFMFFYKELKRKIGKDQKWQAKKQQQGSIKHASTRILLIDIRFLRGAPDARLIRNAHQLQLARSFSPDKQIHVSFAVFYLLIHSTDVVHSSGRKSTPLLPSRPCA